MARPQSAKSILRNARKQSYEPKTAIATNMYIPNHSGDLSRGDVKATPGRDYAPVNKKYVDDEISSKTHWDRTGTDVHLKTSTDNVGIGTSTPDEKLHINSGTDKNIVKFENTYGWGQYYRDSGGAGFLTSNLTGWYIDTAGAGLNSASYLVAGTGVSTISELGQIETRPLADNKGLKIWGYDDVSARWGHIFMDSSGYMNLSASQLMDFTMEGNKIMRVGSSYMRFEDDIRMAFGDSYDYTQGFHSASDTFQIVEGGTLNANIALAVKGTDVGIGTIAPTTKLHVRKDHNASTDITVQNDGTGTAAQARIVMQSNSSAGTFGAFDDGYTTITELQDKLAFYSFTGAKTPTALTFMTRSNIPVEFYTGGEAAGNKRIIIEGGGNVGIGTGTPGAKLDIAGDIKLSSDVSYPGPQNGMWHQANYGTIIEGNGTDGAVYLVVSGGSTGLILDDTGNVGIGVIDPHSTLEVDGAISSATSTFSTAGPTDNVDVTNVNTLFIDTSSNNVTIGGLAGGVAGQVLYIAVKDASNNTILEHNEGGGSQNIFLNSGADETLTASYGGWVLVCDGSNWYNCNN